MTDDMFLERSPKNLTLARSIDAGNYASSSLLIEEMLQGDPPDPYPHYGRLLIGFGERDVHKFVASFSEFLVFLSRHWPHGLTPEIAPVALRVIEQASRMAETFFGDQAAQYPSYLFGFLADQARSAREIAVALGETEIAEAMTKVSARYWQCADARDESVSRTIWRPDTPSLLQVEPTNECNLKCVMCPRTTEMTRAIGHMDPDVWRHILASWSGREVISEYENLLSGEIFYAARKGAVKLFNFGEFLMLPQFEKFIEIAKELNCAVGVQTNGVLLSRPDIRARLLAAKPHGVAISIDGFSPETYEAVRDGSRWRVLQKGVNAFIAERDAAGLTDEISVNLTSILPDDRPQSRDQITQFLSTLADGRLEISFLKLNSSHKASFFDTDGSLGDIAFKPTYSVTPDRPSCAEPITKMQILSDGQVTACCYDINGEINVGHALQGVDAVWQSSEMRRLQEAHLRHELAGYPLCQQCLGVNADGTRPEIAPKS